MGFVCYINVVTIGKKWKRRNARSSNTSRETTETITKAGSSRPHQGRHPNTSVALTSFTTLSAHNPNVQVSRQQGSNLGNREDLSDVEATYDNPAYGFLGTVHEESDYENVENIYDEIK